jgi:hypothetical protein
MNMSFPRDWVVDAAGWQWALVVGIAALTAAVLYGWKTGIARNTTGGGLTTIGRLFLGTLRFAVLAALGFLLLEPLIRNLTFDEERPVAIVLMDESRSITARTDSAVFAESANQWTTQLREQLEMTGLDVELYGYDKDLRTVDATENWIWNGSQTNLSAAIQALSTRIENRNVAGMVLVSDGLVNRGAAPDYGIAWPNTPVWTVGVGDTTVVRDRWIGRVQHNAVAYLGNQFPVEVYVETQGYQGETTRVEIFQGTQSVASAERSASSNRETQKFSFMLTASQLGMQAFEVRVAAVDDEFDKQNNRRINYIEVRESRRRITCIANAPHPDLGAIQMALAPLEAYEIETFVLSTLKDGAALTESLTKSDVVIAHNVLGTSFGGMSWPRLLGMNEVPVWWVGASEATTAFLQAKNDLGVQLTNTGDLNQTHRCRLNPNFSMLSFPQNTEETLRSYPPLLGPFEQASWTPAWSPILFRQFGDVETNDAFWAARNTATSPRQILTIGEGIWRWRMRGFIRENDHTLFNEFIQRQVQFLAAKDSRKRLTVQTEKRTTTDDRLLFQAQAFDAAWNPTADATIQLVLSDERGQVFSQTMLPASSGYAADFGRMPEGAYRWIAECNLQGTEYRSSGNIIVEDKPIEQVSLAADFGMLTRIGNSTGGGFLGPLAATLPESVLTRMQSAGIPSVILHEQTTLQDAVDWWVWLVLCLMVLSLEWVIRRRTLGY